MLTEIWTRQSIRRYEDRTVEKEKLEELLRAAMHAPTARNTQSWRFMVIRNRKALDEMTTPAALYRNDENSALRHSCDG